MKTKPRQEDIDFLAHYGVKGMKWGVRRDENVLNRLAGRRMLAIGGSKEDRKKLRREASEDWKNYKKSTPRKQQRIDKKHALTDRGEYLVKKAMEDPDIYLRVATPHSPAPTLSTGSEFLQYLTAGGTFDVKYTDIMPFQKKD